MIKSQVERELKAKASPEKAAILSRFFKTGLGQYGEGDIFWGVMVPVQRVIAKNNVSISLVEVQALLNSKIHELRLTALLILVEKYGQADNSLKKKIVDFYLKNTNNINNWDLVDLSAPKILGDYLLNQDREVLLKLAISKKLWEKRIAIISTFAFIRQNQFKETIKIAEILLSDDHDLIQKAVGWMLREIGKRDLVTELKFLEKYSTRIPRTMLRYAIEKFPEKKRKEFLNKK